MMGILEELLDQAVQKLDNFPEGSALWRHFDHGRIHLVGPWRFRDGTKWQAIADPYNATGAEYNREIEGIGSTPQEALLNLLEKMDETELKEHRSNNGRLK